MNKWPYVAFASAWIATGVAVCFAVYITKDASCLWAFLLPSFLSLKYTSEEKSEK